VATRRAFLFILSVLFSVGLLLYRVDTLQTSFSCLRLLRAYCSVLTRIAGLTKFVQNFD